MQIYYRFLCVLFLPMSECYLVSVLNENALCLLVEILPGVGCDSWHMKTEFWCAHTKHKPCKRLLGPIICLVPQCFWQLFVQTYVLCTKLCLIGPSHVCIYLYLKPFIASNRIAFGTFGWLDWLDYEMFQFCVVSLFWTSLIVRQLWCVLQSPSATFFGSLIVNFCFPFYFPFRDYVRLWVEFKLNCGSC